MKPIPFSAVALIAVLTVGCEQSSPATVSTDVEPDSAQSSSKPPAVNAPAKTRGGAQITLGDQQFSLDRVTCLSFPTPTGIAVDSADRSELPDLKVSVSDGSDGSPVQQTASIDFRRLTPRQLWLYETGTGTFQYDADAKVFTASGQAKGRLMVPAERGNDQSAPMPEPNVKPFQVTVNCR